MKEQIEVMISEEEVGARICELARELNREYAGKKLHLIVILKGSIFFACELARNITVPVTMDFMSVTSYGNGMVSAGKITVTKELDEDIDGRDVLIVEDVIDSGNTLFHLKNLLLARNPASLRIITLVDKKDCRTADVEADYCGFEISDKFVVGYGMDYAQQYRNLRYIGAVIQDEI